VAQFIRESDLAHRRPIELLDGPVQFYRPQLVAHLQRQDLARHALLFPQLTLRGDRMLAFTEAEGAITPYDRLAPDEQAAAREAVRAMLADLEREAQRLRASPDSTRQSLGMVLEAALRGSTLSDIHRVAGEGQDQYVLAGWGLREVEGAPPIPDLLTTLRPVVPVAPPPPQPPPAIAPVSAVPPPPTPPPVGDPPAWPLRLLALAAMLLGFGLLAAWLLPMGVVAAIAALRLPAPPICEVPPAGLSLLPGQEEEARLRARLAELERAYAGRLLQCRLAQAPPPPPPAPAPQPAPAPTPAPPPRQDDFGLDRRLEREGAQRGQVQVSLAWNGPADLDLHVTCPDGRVINFQQPSHCGGTLQIDMNAGGRRSNEPVEDVIWPGTPPSGRYLVHVHYFDYPSRRVPVPFIVRLVNGAERREVRGVANGPNPQQVLEFTVP
jgi:hypothetical protein